VQYLNEEEYAKRMIKSLFERKQKIWKDAAQNYVVVAKSSIEDAAKALDWFSEYEKKDLVVRELGNWAKAIFKSRCQSIVEKIKETVETFKKEGYSLEDVEKAMMIIKHIPEEQKVREELSGLKKALTVVTEVDEEVYFEKVIPFLATIDEKATTELSTIQRGYDSEKAMETDNIKVKINWFGENIRLTLTFKNSKDANRFKEIM